jgi:hypothetical protein
MLLAICGSTIFSNALKGASTIVATKAAMEYIPIISRAFKPTCFGLYIPNITVSKYFKPKDDSDAILIITRNSTSHEYSVVEENIDQHRVWDYRAKTSTPLMKEIAFHKCQQKA